MTTSDPVAVLIERLAELKGPDRELDVLIAAEIDWEGPLVHRPIKQYLKDVGGAKKAVRDIEDGHPLNAFRCIPRYSESIDAALTLLPPNYDFLVSGCEGDYSAEVGPSQSFQNVEVQHLKSTPAIALCIASLKARSA